MNTAERPNVVYGPKRTITTQCGVKVVATHVYDNNHGHHLREEIEMSTPRVRIDSSILRFKS